MMSDTNSEGSGCALNKYPIILDDANIPISLFYIQLDVKTSWIIVSTPLSYSSFRRGLVEPSPIYLKI